MAGAISSPPGHGGMAWSVLQYVRGLRRLGHEVIFVEPIRPDRIVPKGASLAESDDAAYLAHVARANGFTAGWGALLVGSHETVGLSYPALEAIANRCDAVVNLSGLLTDPALLGPAPVRVYVDMDPGFTQIWAAQGADLRLDGHTHYVTLAHDLGAPACPIPSLGLLWIASVPPVVLDDWPVATEPPRNGLTTVGSWRSYGSVHHDGRRYGQKAHMVRQIMDLPSRIDVAVQPAFGIHPDERDDLTALVEAGWCLLDPASVADTPEAYRQFIQHSWAEIGVAKRGYVEARCGWFSDRSACYLASGRPVIAADTGFGSHLPTGRGLLSFSTTEEAVAAVEAVQAHYPQHAAAAREIAVEYLDADRVLGRLLDAVHSRPAHA